MLHRCPRYCSDILSPRSRKQCRYSVYILLSLLFLLFLFLLLLLLLLFLLLFLLLLFLFLLLLLLILLFLLFLLLSLLSGLKVVQPLSRAQAKSNHAEPTPLIAYLDPWIYWPAFGLCGSLPGTGRYHGGYCWGFLRDAVSGPASSVSVSSMSS